HVFLSPALDVPTPTRAIAGERANTVRHHDCSSGDRWSLPLLHWRLSTLWGLAVGERETPAIVTALFVPNSIAQRAGVRGPVCRLPICRFDWRAPDVDPGIADRFLRSEV